MTMQREATQSSQRHKGPAGKTRLLVHLACRFASFSPRHWLIFWFHDNDFFFGVAVCCNALRCCTLQCVVARCSALQCVAVRCSALQCVAVCCSVLQRAWIAKRSAVGRIVLQSKIGLHGSMTGCVLQHVAVRAAITMPV